MLSITYEGNENTIDLINTPNLFITGYEGLDQPTSEIITLSNPNKRGTQYQRSQIADRTITLTFAIYNVENVRYQLMNVFKSGEKGVLTLSNELRIGQIECYFEEMTFNKFENPSTCTIFLRAPNPYFSGLEDITHELDNAVNNFVLEAYIEEEEGIELGLLMSAHTLSLINESDKDVGVTIEFIAHDVVVNPIIYNQTTNKFIGLNYTMNIDDTLVITTSTGNKKAFIRRGSTTINVINSLMANSSFFQLKRGENILNADATSGGNDMFVFIKYRDEYEAI